MRLRAFNSESETEMVSWFINIPGRLYVLATLLPLAAFAVLLVAGLVRTLARFAPSG